MSEPRLVSVLIPAVGGQGGGVLAEWLVEAASAEGLLAHGTSIPGVAQRTGSTTYYVELSADLAGGEPVFSLYPVPGALDVLVAAEFLEVGRAIELGFPSAERTTIVTSTHRLYSIHEKMATGRSLYPTDDLQTAARAFSRALVAFDALAVAREHGTEVNAVLLGALAGCEALPITPASFRAAIERKGIQVAANVRGFEAGLTHGRGGAQVAPSAPAKRPLRVPPAFVDAVQVFSDDLQPIVGEALARLIDYQDERYATVYLERLAPFVGQASDPALGQTVARHLALWMTYEDAIRVADLKTRASRFERIRADARAGDAELVVTDYLKPDLDELYGVLPYRLVAPLARWVERRWPHGRPAVGQHVQTTSVLGFVQLWLLARLRRFRPRSYRAHIEHERMERWLTAVRRCAAWDGALAVEVAHAAQLVKGYGDVRRRMLSAFEDLVQAVLQVASLEALAGDGFGVSVALAAAGRQLVLQGSDAEARARTLTGDVLAKVQAGDRDAARVALKSVA